MNARHLAPAVGLLALMACGESTVAQPDDAPLFVEAPSQAAAPNPELASLYALPGAFHGAFNSSDQNAMYSLWTPDAVVWAAGVGCEPCTGPDEIATAFAASGPFINGWAGLSPAYKTRFQVHGNEAEYEFECIYLADGPNLTGTTVLAHLNTRGTMRKVGNRWLFATFQGGVGAL